MSHSDFSLSDSSTDSDSDFELESDTIKELEEKITSNEKEINSLKIENNLLKNELVQLEAVIIGIFILHVVMWWSGNLPIY